MDEATQKDWEGLQRKVMENQGQLKAVRTFLRFHG
jgi:hypothetical protein